MIKLEKLVWEDPFTFGDTVIDNYRKEIVAVIQSILEEEVLDLHSELFSDALTKLTTISIRWLPLEEKFWGDLLCINFTAHQQSHKKFTLGVVSLCTDTSSGKLDPEEARKILSDLSDEVLFSSYSQCAECLCARGVSGRIVCSKVPAYASEDRKSGS